MKLLMFFTLSSFTVPLLGMSDEYRKYQHTEIETNYKRSQNRYKINGSIVDGARIIEIVSATATYKYNFQSNDRRAILSFVPSMLIWSQSLGSSEHYLMDAYANSSNAKECFNNAHMGIGLKLNSFIIMAGGANNITSSSQLKYALYGISSTATVMEAVHHGKKAYALWNMDDQNAKQDARWHLFRAGLYVGATLLPFVLDKYTK